MNSGGGRELGSERCCVSREMMGALRARLGQRSATKMISLRAGHAGNQCTLGRPCRNRSASHWTLSRVIRGVCRQNVFKKVGEAFQPPLCCTLDGRHDADRGGVIEARSWSFSTPNHPSQVRSQTRLCQTSVARVRFRSVLALYFCIFILFSFSLDALC